MRHKCSWPKVAVFFLTLSIAFILLFFVFPMDDVIHVFLMEDANETNITTNQTHLPTFNSNHTVEPTISPIKNEEILSSSRYDTTGGNITTNQSHSPTFN